MVRYSALVGGIVFGIFHRRTLQAKLEASTVAAEYKKREHWIEEAKKAWAQKQLANDGRSSSLPLSLWVDMLYLILLPSISSLRFRQFHRFLLPCHLPLLLQNQINSRHRPRCTRIRFRESLEIIGVKMGERSWKKEI